MSDILFLVEMAVIGYYGIRYHWDFLCQVLAVPDIQKIPVVARALHGECKRNRALLATQAVSLRHTQHSLYFKISIIVIPFAMYIKWLTKYFITIKFQLRVCAHVCPTNRPCIFGTWPKGFRHKASDTHLHTQRPAILI